MADLAIHNDEARRIIRAILSTSDPEARDYLRRALRIDDSKIKSKRALWPDPEADAIVNAAEYFDFLTPDLWAWLQARAAVLDLTRTEAGGARATPAPGH